MPFDPTYEIDDDTIAVGDFVQVPGGGSSFIKNGETGSVIATESSYSGQCKRAISAVPRFTAGSLLPGAH